MKQEEQIRERLAFIEMDQRLHYPAENVYINAPLALVQTSLETQADTLRWILDMPPFKRGGEKA